MKFADVYVQLPEELLREIEKKEKSIDSVVARMLDAGVAAVLPEVEKRLDEAANKGYSTGELKKALTVKKKVSKKGGAERVITFKGTRVRKAVKSGKENKATNNLIAAVLEYGKSDQEPRPFMRPAFAAKKEEINRAMKEVWERRMENG